MILFPQKFIFFYVISHIKDSKVSNAFSFNVFINQICMKGKTFFFQAGNSSS